MVDVGIAPSVRIPMDRLRLGHIRETAKPTYLHQQGGDGRASNCLCRQNGALGSPFAVVSTSLTDMSSTHIIAAKMYSEAGGFSRTPSGMPTTSWRWMQMETYIEATGLRRKTGCRTLAGLSDYLVRSSRASDKDRSIRETSLSTYHRPFRAILASSLASATRP